MKNPIKHASPKGFTLVELLVVIAIIAVLAAAGFAGGRAAINKAKKVTAQAAATSIAANIESFYSDYSALPGPSGTTPSADTTYSTAPTDAAGIYLLNVLAGEEPSTATSLQNSKKIRYLSVKDAKGSSNNARDGATYVGNGNALEGLFDPWGQPYFIQLDYDYDENLQTDTGISGVDKTLRGKKSAVWSLGVDEGAEDEADSSTIAKTW